LIIADDDVAEKKLEDEKPEDAITVATSAIDNLSIAPTEMLA